MPRKKKDDKQYLTQEGYDKLQKEMNDLIDTKLPLTLERLKEAISQWDISENAEYDTAMTEKDLIQGRIAEIKEMLRDVEIIKHTKKWGEIRYGSVVILEDDKKRKSTFTIVGSWEVDVLEGTISFESPVWTALEWKKKGDTVTVRAPSRRYDIKIVDVK